MTSHDFLVLAVLLLTGLFILFVRVHISFSRTILIYASWKMRTILQMKGEKELIEKILQTEIKIFRSIRDGSALMQHMEDFYYISLLEVQKVHFILTILSLIDP